MNDQKLLQQSLRIRYEAFSNYASAVSKATTMEAVAEAIAIHAKYILDVYCLQYLFTYKHFRFCFQISRGKVEVIEQAHTEIMVWQDNLLRKGVPLYFTDRTFLEEAALKGSFFDKAPINALYALPLLYSNNQQVVIEVASKTADPYTEPDFRFVKLLAELAANKLAQLFLLLKLENKNKELEDVNEELSCLNEEIRNLNLHLEEEVQKRTVQLTEANQELNTIFYRTSHDFRGPLTSVLGITNLAKYQTSDPAMLQLFSHCEASILKLDKMLQKLKLLSYHEEAEGSPGYFIAENLVNKVVHSFMASIERKKLKVILQCSQGLQLFGEESVFVAILENLLENSIVFSSAGTRIKVALVANGSGATMEVQDEGEGIPDMYLDKVLQMYFKASENSEGNGLGLYVVKRLLDRLGGVITIQSKSGQGTTVKVFIPSR